jgi:hypothetical protein
MLAGLDPADEIDFAMAFGKLWSLHLNDQNGLKFDQDKPFGSANLRVAFNQVRALERNGYGKNGEYVCFDVHPFRPTKVSIGSPISRTAAAPSSAWCKRPQVNEKAAKASSPTQLAALDQMVIEQPHGQ